MEWIISLSLVALGLFFLIWKSDTLLDYSIWLLALNREIRRIVDFYYNGHFNPLSPISLTPLFIGGLLFCAAWPRTNKLKGRSRLILLLFLVTLTHGLLIGLIVNKLSAIYSLGEWVASLGALLFAATSEPKQQTRWILTAGWAGIVVSIYGLFQYYTIPKWDAMWLEQSGMMGYMGIPEPTLMTCFSTLNERGPCAAFLGWAVLPMLLDKQWRTFLGWLPVPLLLFVMMLTQVRTMFIVVALTAILHPLLARGRNFGGILILALLICGISYVGLEKLPSGQNFADRMGSESLVGQSSSLSGRFIIYREVAGIILLNPLGWGLGSSGMASRVGAAVNVGDAGYLQIFAQFGWIGSGCFFAALYLIWIEATDRFKTLSDRGSLGKSPFPAATRSILLAMLAFLFVTDAFAGFSLVWVILGSALVSARNSMAQVDHIQNFSLKGRGIFSIGASSQ